jgi:hypothetical protein
MKKLTIAKELQEFCLGIFLLQLPGQWSDAWMHGVQVQFFAMKLCAAAAAAPSWRFFSQSITEFHIIL